MHIRFKSITRHGIGYVIQPYSWTHSRDYSQILSDHMFEYPTYGDGLTIHGEPYEVSKDWFVDCLGSLAAYLFENPNSQDDLKDIEGFWPTDIDNSKMDFYMGLKFNPDKPMYYSANEYKVSNGKSKAYDRRWELVPEWADGTMAATLRFLRGATGRRGAVEVFGMYLQLKDYYFKVRQWSDTIEGYGTNLSDDFYHLRDAFIAVDYHVRAYRNVYYARRLYEALQENWIDKQGKQSADGDVKESA